MKRLLLLALMCLGLMSLFACAVNPHDPEVMNSRYLEGLACYENQDFDQAFAILKPLALKGHANAQYYVALMSYKGEGTTLYPQEGAVMLFKAAQQGHVEAMYKLAMAYDQSAGVLPNQERALYWMSKSGEAVYMDATGWKYSMTPVYSHPYPTPRYWYQKPVYPIALYWFHKSVDPNDYAMLYDTAQRYRLGTGVEQNLPKAANMYHHLAVTENPYQADAQYELGIMFYTGYGVDRDIAQARGWLQLAANGGHTLAAQDLAELNSNFPPTGEEEPFTPELLIAPDPALQPIEITIEEAMVPTNG